jgi:hypothetical protein
MILTQGIFKLVLYKIQLFSSTFEEFSHLSLICVSERRHHIRMRVRFIRKSRGQVALNISLDNREATSRNCFGCA